VRSKGPEQSTLVPADDEASLTQLSDEGTQVRPGVFRRNVILIEDLRAHRSQRAQTVEQPPDEGADPGEHEDGLQVSHVVLDGDEDLLTGDVPEDDIFCLA